MKQVFHDRLAEDFYKFSITVAFLIKYLGHMSSPRNLRR